jgi:hypothetical protein
MEGGLGTDKDIRSVHPLDSPFWNEGWVRGPPPKPPQCLSQGYVGYSVHPSVTHLPGCRTGSDHVATQWLAECGLLQIFCLRRLHAIVAMLFTSFLLLSLIVVFSQCFPAVLWSWVSQVRVRCPIWVNLCHTHIRPLSQVDRDQGHCIKVLRSTCSLL